jgi:hypothetical protein
MFGPASAMTANDQSIASPEPSSCQSHSGLPRAPSKKQEGQNDELQAAQRQQQQQQAMLAIGPEIHSIKD